MDKAGHPVFAHRHDDFAGCAAGVIDSCGRQAADVIDGVHGRGHDPRQAENRTRAGDDADHQQVEVKAGPFEQLVPGRVDQAGVMF